MRIPDYDYRLLHLKLSLISFTKILFPKLFDKEFKTIVYDIESYDKIN